MRKRKSPVGVNKIDWTPALLSRLGKISDTDLAEELGITPASIQGMRARRGIPRFRDAGRLVSGKRVRKPNSKVSVPIPDNGPERVLPPAPASQEPLRLSFVRKSCPMCSATGTIVLWSKE